MTWSYDDPMRHHTLDCNEGAIYNGGMCECSSMCADEAMGSNMVVRDRVSGALSARADIHVCDRLPGHDGEHKCGCGQTWSAAEVHARRGGGEGAK